MTKDQWLAALRQFLQVVAGSLVTLGYLTSGKAEILIGVVVAAVSFGWMFFAKKAQAAEVEQKIQAALYTPVPK